MLIKIFSKTTFSKVLNGFRFWLRWSIFWWKALYGSLRFLPYQSIRMRIYRSATRAIDHMLSFAEHCQIHRSLNTQDTLQIRFHLQSKAQSKENVNILIIAIDIWSNRGLYKKEAYTDCCYRRMYLTFI